MTERMLMRAAVYERYGSPDVLSLREVSLPSIGDDEVLVKVKFSTVNRTDCGFLRGKPFIVRFFAGLMRPKSQILGCEFSGDVVEVGSNVSKFKVGDRVFGFKDDDYGFGGQAEFTSMSVNGMLVKIPDNVTYQLAAAGLEGSHYALHYIRSTRIGEGTRVLVNGGTGAIGSAAIQIVKSMGAEVTAVCGTPNLETVRGLGANEVIDYLTEDFTQLGSKFDVVFDAVGKSTFGRCRRLLHEHGSYASTELGPYAQNPFLAIYTKFIGKQKVHFPIPKNETSDAEYISGLMERDLFKPLIDRTYPLEQVADAFRYVEQGEKIGNVLVKVS